MIARLRGTLVERDGSACLVECGGVGYEVLVPLSTSLRLPPDGGEVTLLTSFLVREDAQQLFGFLTRGERDAFLLLQTVKGVGPRVALAMLSSLAPAELRDAILKKRLDRLTAVSGVGKKLAERVVLELSDKAAALAPGEAAPAQGAAPARGEDALQAQAVQALQALGFTPAASRAAVQKAAADLGAGAGVEALVKLALKYA